MLCMSKRRSDVLMGSEEDSEDTVLERTGMDDGLKQKDRCTYMTWVRVNVCQLLLTFMRW